MKTNPIEPSTGAFDGKVFVFPVRVYYEDTDFSGVVYHANYLRFMERGRSEFLRTIDVRHQGLLKAEEPLVWVVRKITVDYKRPARVDDALNVRTYPLAMSGARMTLRQDVCRMNDVLVSADVDVCVITLDGKPRRIPDDIRGKLAVYLADTEQS